MTTLLDKLQLRIDNEHSALLYGEWSGLCTITHRAYTANEIAVQERDALRSRVRQWVAVNGRGSFVVFDLSPEFARMIANGDEYMCPNDTSRHAADLWRAWAIEMVKQAQKELWNAGKPDTD